MFGVFFVCVVVLFVRVRAPGRLSVVVARFVPKSFETEIREES